MTRLWILVAVVLLAAGLVGAAPHIGREGEAEEEHTNYSHFGTSVVSGQGWEIGKNSLYNQVMSKLKENRTAGKHVTFTKADCVCNSDTHWDWYLTGVSALLSVCAIVLWIWRAFQARPAVVRPSIPSTSSDDPSLEPTSHNAPANPFVFIPFPPSSAPLVRGREEEYRLHERLRIAVNTTCLSYQNFVNNTARGQPRVDIIDQDTTEGEDQVTNAARGQPRVAIIDQDTTEGEIVANNSASVLMDSKKQSDVADELGKTQSEVKFSGTSYK